MYLYYIELEKIDSDQDAVEISSTAKTEIEPATINKDDMIDFAKHRRGFNSKKCELNKKKRLC